MSDEPPSYVVWRHGRPWLFVITAHAEPNALISEWKLWRGLLELAENGKERGRTLVSASPYPRVLLDTALASLDGPVDTTRGYRSPGRISPEQAGLERAFVLSVLGDRISYAIVPAATGRFRLFRRSDQENRWEGLMTDLRFLVLVDVVYRLLAVP